MENTGTAESTTPITTPINSDTVTADPVTVTESQETEPVTVTESQEAAPEEAAPEEAAPVDDVELDLEKLIAAAFDDPVMSGEHKGLPPYQDILKHLPENGRKLIQNLRSSYTRKTQEIAEVRKQLEAERSNLLRQRQMLAQGPGAKQLAELASAEVSDFDPWSAESMEAKIRSEAARMVQSLIKPMQDDLAVATRRQELSTFKDAHPDLMDDQVKASVVNLLKSRSDLRLEDAYYLVKGKQHEARLRQLEEEKTAQRSASRQTLRKTSTGRSIGTTKPPKFKDAWKAFQYHKNNQ